MIPEFPKRPGSYRGIYLLLAARPAGPVRPGRRVQISRRPGFRIGRASPHAERREVIMQHEFPVLLTDQGIHPLLVRGCPQRRNRQGLRFASGEKGRTVRSGQHADLTPDGTNIRQAASVYALALVNNRRAHDFAGQLFQGFCNLPALARRTLPRAPESLLAWQT